MKKIFLTAISLMIIGVLPVCAAELTVTEDEYRKMDIDTPVDITIKSFLSAYNNSNVSEFLNVPRNEILIFFDKLHKYWNTERNVFHVSVLDVYAVCGEHFLRVFNRNQVVNRNQVEAVSAYCAELPIYALKYQMEENKILKTIEIPYSTTYVYTLNSIGESNNVSWRAINDMRQDYKMEIVKKYCSNGTFRYDNSVPMVTCNGVDLLTGATGKMQQDLMLFLWGSPVVVYQKYFNMPDGKIKAEVLVDYKAQ